MKIKTLRAFQEDAVNSGVALFKNTKHLLDVAGADINNRKLAINHNGYLLIEAPTGSGKTLMAGCIVENFTHVENVVWFWFAPFKGVVGQTANFLREQFQGLRLRELATDRANEGSRSGDTFVTTWQTVATRVTDKRNVRKEREDNPSIDTLLDGLRAQGLRIGVVVDEAHHGFGKDTQAAIFFREILRPEYTILITATPDDADVTAFEKTMGIAELQRIRVSRADAVSAGLIKTGVKCVAYCVSDSSKTSLVDFQSTALRDAISAHRQLKANLNKLKIPLVPLLLVQADSKEKSIEKLKERLLSHGFREEQIATHTAAEPDADLLAIANDERREVLVFKMAVALGFDAPRAFTLVSMRASRDADFGIQLIGRLLRVHRLLQTRAQNGTLPEELNSGYVFLSDISSQDGLDRAGQRINQIQTEYAKISATTIVLKVGNEQETIGTVNSDGQIEFSLISERAPSDGKPLEIVPAPSMQHSTEFDFGKFFSTASSTAPVPTDGPRPTNDTPPAPGPTGKYCYKLRPDVPRVFKTQIVSADNEATEEDCAQQFIISARDLLNAIKNKVPVERRTLEVFTSRIQQEFNFAADFSGEHAAILAQKALCENEIFDPRELRRALLRKLETVMREEAMEEAGDPKKILAFLNTILVSNPKLLLAAQKAAIAKNAEIQDAEVLPEAIYSTTPLASSARNIYGIYPEGMNTWETTFTQSLDRDSNGIVLWWHRNESRKPCSVNVLMPNGRGFFPDFIVGIRGRKTENNVLLVDPKFYFADKEQHPKVQSEHKIYGKVMIVFQDPAKRWFTVTWDYKKDAPVAEREFHLSDTVGF